MLTIVRCRIEKPISVRAPNQNLPARNGREAIPSHRFEILVAQKNGP
jgi:hypothetical protein